MFSIYGLKITGLTPSVMKTLVDAEMVAALLGQIQHDLAADARCAGAAPSDL
ncbi:hypothetical protein LP415_00060 [Polaromonas sp. P1(28)-8]|nr:hypothetical protein LP415_00060 [Polaromonas sp. P1(28)-8]